MDYFDYFDDMDVVGGGLYVADDGPPWVRTQRRRAEPMTEMSDNEFRRTFRFSKEHKTLK